MHPLGVHFFCKKKRLGRQDSKRSERRPKREEEAPGMAPEASGDAVEGAARRAATETANLSSQIERNAFRRAATVRAILS